MLVPACGGTEKPFMMKGRRLQYMWDNTAKYNEPSHVYVDLDSDMILSDEEVSDLFLTTDSSIGQE